jgi:catechol 2,3-dioxygenase-like lactoylglutathione lyase family enzyme
MLGDKTAVVTIGVKDIEVAKKFYEGVLGLTSENDGDPSGVRYKSGNSYIFIYTSEYAGTNKATAVSWGVGEDLDSVVHELKNKGVKFETYDMPNVTRDGDIHIMGDIKSAWFKDPDGNILNIVNKM